MTVYGYARVSTGAQDHGGQVDQLQAAGAEKVFAEAASGSTASKRVRPQLQRALQALQPGDVLLVTGLDRLARSARDALNVMGAVAERQAGFRSLREPWADTTTAAGRLMVTIFAGLAEFEREMILARTAEGRAAAKARGRRMGRPGSLSASQLRYIREARAASPPVSIPEIARVLGSSRSTVARVLRADRRGLAVSPAPPRQVDIEELAGRPGEAAAGEDASN